MNLITRNTISYIGTEDYDPPLSVLGNVVNTVLFLGLMVVLGLYAFMLQ